MSRVPLGPRPRGPMSRLLVSPRMDAGGMSSLQESPGRVHAALGRSLRRVSSRMRPLRIDLHQLVHLLKPKTVPSQIARIYFPDFSSALAGGAGRMVSHNWSVAGMTRSRYPPGTPLFSLLLTNAKEAVRWVSASEATI